MEINLGILKTAVWLLKLNRAQSAKGTTHQ